MKAKLRDGPTFITGVTSEKKKENIEFSSHRGSLCPGKASQMLVLLLRTTQMDREILMCYFALLASQLQALGSHFCL